MRLFRKGDYIKCICSAGSISLKKDKVYKVLSDQTSSETSVFFEFGDSNRGSADSSRFELYRGNQDKKGGFMEFFKKGDMVKCIDGSCFASIKTGGVYEVYRDQVDKHEVRIIVGGNNRHGVYPPSLFTPDLKREEEQKDSKENYTLKLSSPYLLSYDRLYKEAIEDTGAKVAKVTAKAEGLDTYYLLLVDREVLKKGLLQEGGHEILDKLGDLGVLIPPSGPTTIRPLTIKQWAEAYSLVKKLIKLPLYKELKRETTVNVEILEVC